MDIGGISIIDNQITSIESSSVVIEGSSGGSGSVASGSVPVVTEWTSFEMLIEGSTSDPTKATTPVVDQAYWRRIGDSMEITYTYAHTSTTGAANGSGDYLFKLPAGYTIDLTKATNSLELARDIVGSAAIFDGTTHVVGYPKVYNSTSLALLLQSSNGFVSSSNIALATGATRRYTFTARVPIATWDASDTSVGSIGAAISDWTEYALTVDATTTAPTTGTVVTNRAYWRRIGDSMQVRYDFRQTSAGTAGSGTYLFPIPSGYTIDTGKVNARGASEFATGVVGTAGSDDSSTTNQGETGYMAVYDSTNLVMYVGDSGNNPQTVNSTWMAFSSTHRGYSFIATVPIVGWSNNVTLSEGASIEYAHNTDTTNADDTTSFSNTSAGSLVPSVSSSQKKKRVRFQSDILSSDKLILQIQEDGSGAWIDSGQSKFGPYGFEETSQFHYGVYLESVSGSSTDVDVVFQGEGASYTDGTGTTTWSTENSNGTRWRVVKAASQIPVQIETDNIAAIGDWQQFSMTIDAVTTAPTKGTIATDKAYWRRVGDSMHIRYDYYQTGAGSAGSGTYLFKMPAGYKIDSSKITTDTSTTQGIVGSAGFWSSAVTTAYGNVNVYDNESFVIAGEYDSNDGTISSSFFALSNTTVQISFEALVPIVGWSSNLAIADDAQVEYLYNSDTTGNNELTAFANGTNGGLVPTNPSASGINKRVRASKPLSGAQIYLQIQENGIGPWLNVGDSDYAEYFNSSTSSYIGMSMSVFSATDIDVRFNRDSSGLFRGTSWTTENSNGTRWRVKVVYNPSSVEAPENSQVVYLKDVKSSGTDAGIAASGSYQTRVLNTLEDPNSLGWCSLASNQFTLQPGTYEIEWQTPFYAVQRCKSRLRNVSDLSDTVIGASHFTNTADDVSLTSNGFGNFTISASKVFEIQYYSSTNNSATDLGRAATTGIDEVYTQVKIRKLS